MASVDLRTRSSRDLRRVDPQGFLGDELPALYDMDPPDADRVIVHIQPTDSSAMAA